MVSSKLIPKARRTLCRWQMNPLNTELKYCAIYRSVSTLCRNLPVKNMKGSLCTPIPYIGYLRLIELCWDEVVSSLSLVCRVHFSLGLLHWKLWATSTDLNSVYCFRLVWHVAMRIVLLLALVVFMTSLSVSETSCPAEEDELLPCRCSSRGDEIQLW
jgi:hypothetical protein